MKSRCILFFNENPMPSVYTQGTIPAKELRLRTAMREIDSVHVIARPGSYIQTLNKKVGPLEKKVQVHLTIPWPYYGAGFVHFFYGIYYILKYRPIVLEAESGIISGPAVVLLGKLFHIPTVVELRASYEELIKVHARLVPYVIKKILLQWVTQFSYSQATALVANSKTYQTYLSCRGFRSTEINPGLQFAPSRVSNQGRQNVICYLGRLVDEKGVDDLIHAIHSIQKILLHERWHVWVVGDGIRRRELERLSNSLGLHDIIEFKGSQPNYTTLSCVRILVNPCFVKHPLEMVNVEAAWSNVPVVCYGDAAIPETVIGNQTGIKVPYRNVKKLARAIQQLIEHSELRSTLGENGHAFAQKYVFSKQIDQLRNVYHQLGLF
jgi:glycosyltransferase involved in cell wall biosynthesis